MSISKGIFTTNQPAPQRLHLLLPNNNQISQNQITHQTKPSPPRQTHKHTHHVLRPTTTTTTLPHRRPRSIRQGRRRGTSCSPFLPLIHSQSPHILTTLPTVRHRRSNRLRNLERLSRNRQSRRYRRDESRERAARRAARWVRQGRGVGGQGGGV